MAVSFDGVTKIIQLPSTGSYDTEIDLYSDWKEWVMLSDNAKFEPAFDTTGGDDIGAGQEIAPYFFLRTDLGWKIRAPEQDGDVIIQGNLFPRVSGQSLFLPPIGSYTVLITQSLSARAVVINLDDLATSVEVQSVQDRVDLLPLAEDITQSDDLFDTVWSGKDL